MKKFLLLVTFLTVGLTSCSKDDDSTNGESTLAPIEGKWAFYKDGSIVGGQEILLDYPNECPTKKDFIELVSGGIANDVYHYSDCVADVQVGTWSKSGNNISIVIDALGVAQEGEIISLTSTTLKVKYIDDEGVTRVSIYTRL